MGIRSWAEANGVFILMIPEVSTRTHRISATPKAFDLSAVARAYLLNYSR
jgi:hypothetical protein